MKYLVFLSAAWILYSCQPAKPVIHVLANETNDLVNVLNKNYHLVFHQSPIEAVADAAQGEAILILASSYPQETTTVDEYFYEQVKSKELRAYIEYPSSVPGQGSFKIIPGGLKRAVFTHTTFCQSIDSLDILVLNGMHYCDLRNQKNIMVAAKIAGFDEAVYGLPDEVAPLLFELTDYPVLISTTCFSRMITARYAPQAEWEALWSSIIQFLLPEEAPPNISWTPDVLPMYDQDEPLPENSEQEAVSMGIDWFANAKMLLHESMVDSVSGIHGNLLPWRAEIPLGDGRAGALEAIMSVIDEQGSQPIGVVRRGDCIGETAMTFAVAGALLEEENYLLTASNLLDFYLKKSPAAENEWVDPNHGAYGLIPWGITNYAWYRANYGDDNARQLLGIMTTAALTKKQDWDTIAMRCLLAQLRTTGIHGFRGSRIDLPDFAQNGWLYYQNRDIINIAPHFESYLWACFLWAYNKTKYEPFLQKAKSAIRITMENYPQNWRWTNGLSQEKARMLLCLAWLVRVEPSQEHQTWLLTLAYDLIALQDSSGAIREELGEIKMGKYPPPQSNEAYGTNEASLLGKNGDQVSDLLYTTNFAFLGLHEAAHATQDPTIIAAENKLAGFLVRIQVNAPKHPEIHGGWFRAFDYGRYEHWGCNADHGWGAWCIESGWTQGWITTLLGLRQLETCIWDLTLSSGVATIFDNLLVEMGLSTE